MSNAVMRGWKKFDLSSSFLWNAFASQSSFLEAKELPYTYPYVPANYDDEYFMTMMKNFQKVLHDGL